MATRLKPLFLLAIAAAAVGCWGGDGGRADTQAAAEAYSFDAKEGTGDSEWDSEAISDDREQVVTLQDRVRATWGENYEIIGSDSGEVLGEPASPILLLNDKDLRIGEGDEFDLHQVAVYDQVEDRLVGVGFRSLYLVPSPDAHASYKTYLDVAQSVSKVFGDWNGYFYVYDHNENGRDEVIGLSLSGMDFVLRIYEYHDGAFRSVFPYIAGSATLALEAPAPGELVTYRRDFSVVDRVAFLRSRYQWDPETALYQLNGVQSVDEYPEP